MKKWIKWGVGIFVALIVIAAIAGGGEDSPSGAGEEAAATTSETSGSSKQESKGKGGGGDSDEGCGTTASSDCTPRVGPKGQVRVDALYYRIVSARTAETLGDQTYGMGAEADGIFVILKMRIRSDKDESVTLTGSTMQIEVNGAKYDPNTQGTVAAIGASEEPFFLKDLGPDVSTTGTVVYDIPKSALRKKPELRINELGFGDGHAFIRLPSL